MIARQSVEVEDPLNKRRASVSKSEHLSSGETSFVFVETPGKVLTRNPTVIHNQPDDGDVCSLLESGEEKQALIPNVKAVVSGEVGLLLLSQYRLLFLLTDKKMIHWSIPLASILDIKSGPNNVMDIKTKDCRFVQVSSIDFAKPAFFKLLQSLVFSISPHSFFPVLLASNKNHLLYNNSIYTDVSQELGRWKFFHNDEKKNKIRFEISSANSDFSLCSTYPRLLLVPANLPASTTLEGTARFRDKGRFPVLSWASSFGSSIWRSSQPKASLINRSLDDEEYLKHAQINLIMDCRPMLNAYANIANGAGVETLNNYHPGVELVFAGIQNIHHVRDSWENMFCLSHKYATLTSGPWLSQLEATAWYDHIGSILKASHTVVERVTKHGANVLCRCSHGLDRTPQVVSLAMLALDPFYRTIFGFCILVQKEWISMGHRFHSRNCIGQIPNDEFSPIFTQWMECVFQLLATHPDLFEFKSSFLIAVLHAMLSARFGNFLFDCEKERIQHGVLTAEGAVVEDLWPVLLAQKHRFTNRNYSQPSPDESIVLEIDTRVSQIKVWSDLWFSLQRVL